MDYALYRKAPTLCHSEFCVRVIDTVHNNNKAQTTDSSCQALYSHESIPNWRELSSLTRVMPVSLLLLWIFLYRYANLVFIRMS